MIKRVFDISFSFLGLVFLIPLFIIISILIVLDSKGKIWYFQKRVGKGNSDFFLIKFRTMANNADTKGLLTIGNKDSRITRVGYYLRKYKLDELPQLFNVLIGNMSLVGPRPEVRKYVDLYNDEQLTVLSVLPGITDWASIEFVNESELLAETNDAEQAYIKEIMPAKLNSNIKYIHEQGFTTDIKIIFLTIHKIITRK